MVVRFQSLLQTNKVREAVDTLILIANIRERWRMTLNCAMGIFVKSERFGS